MFSTFPRMLVLQVMAVSKEAMVVVVGMTRVAKEGLVGGSKVSFLTACVLHMTCSSLKPVQNTQA